MTNENIIRSSCDRLSCLISDGYIIWSSQCIDQCPIAKSSIIWTCDILIERCESDSGIIISWSIVCQTRCSNSNIRFTCSILREGKRSKCWIKCSCRGHSKRWWTNIEIIVSWCGSLLHYTPPCICTGSPDTVAMWLNISFDIEWVFWNGYTDSNMSSNKIRWSIPLYKYLVDPCGIKSICKTLILRILPTQSMDSWREIVCDFFPVFLSGCIDRTWIRIETECKYITSWFRTHLPIEWEEAIFSYCNRLINRGKWAIRSISIESHWIRPWKHICTILYYRYSPWSIRSPSCWWNCRFKTFIQNSRIDMIISY